MATMGLSPSAHVASVHGDWTSTWKATLSASANRYTG